LVITQPHLVSKDQSSVANAPNFFMSRIKLAVGHFVAIL